MAALDLSLLRTSKGDRIASHLQSKKAELGISATTTGLFEALSKEAIPSTVLMVWIDVSKDDSVLKQCLDQDYSRILRRAAIRRFIRRLNGGSFETTWKSIGGTQGIIQFLSQCAVHELKLFCHLLAGLANTNKNQDTIRRHTTSLLHSLCSRDLPDAEFQNVDSRPLLKQYSQLLPACEPEFVKSWLNNPSLPYFKTKELINAHPEVCQSIIVDALQDKSHDRADRLVEDMLETIPETCPPKVENVSQLSPSMSLSLQLLNKLPQSQFKDQYRLTTLSTILMRRLARYRKRIGAADLASTWSTLIKLVESKHIQETHIIRAVTSFLQSWSPQSQQFGSLLTPLLQLRKTITIEDICTWTRRTAQPSRTDFAKIAIKTAPSLKVDIEDLEDLKSGRSRFPVDLFLLLPPANALTLLNSVEKVNPDLTSISIAYSSKTLAERDIWGREIATDPQIMRILLSRDGENAERTAATIIADAKQKAEMERDRNERSNKVVKVIKLSMATGSLSTLLESFKWTRRYIKDQQTLSSLSSGSLIDDNNATLPRLLAGFGYYPYAKLPTAEQLRDRVTTGNSVIEHLFETATLSVSEPGFQQYIWQHVFCLMKFVVRWRSEKMNWLQNVVGLSADEIYTSVWEPTIESCTRIEAISSKESNAILFENFYTVIEGPMFAGYGSALELEEKTLHASTLRFINTLAERRDRFWTDKRAAGHSDIVLLSSIWPRGLPVECLVPIKKLESYAWQGLPYIEQRAKDVVFFDGKAAADVVDDDLKNAISAFVNDYGYSLKFWVKCKKEKVDQEERMLAAWKHAVANTPSDRFTAEQLRYFWFDKFDKCFDFLPEQLIAVRDSIVIEPNYDEPEMVTEWNPQPGNKSASDEEEVKYPIIALDGMFSVVGWRNGEGLPEPIDFQRQIKPIKIPVYFHNGSHWKELRDDGEKYILASLLTLETRHGASGELLSQPFPDAKDSRFPALFLDQDFNEEVGDDDYRQLWLLKAYGTKVPTKITHRLLEIIAKERATGDNHDPSPYMKAMRALLSKDRPLVFLDLVQKLIVDDVEASSWHRHFLHNGLLRRLSASDAATFLDQVVRSIISRLEQTKLDNEAQTAKDDENEEDENKEEEFDTDSDSEQSSAESREAKEKKPTIKLSTIKLLAQLLTNADFVSQDQSLRILTDLFAASSHVDVRIAILQSLFDILKSTSDDQIEQRILTLFKQAILIAAGINEHKLMTEERWQYFESAGKVPMVFRGDGEVGPTLKFLLDMAKEFDVKNDSRKLRLRIFMIDEILLPIWHDSVQSNERWTRLFLKAHGFSEELGRSLPRVPVHPGLLVNLLCNHVNLLPRSVLEMHIAYVEANLERSDKWVQVNSKVTETREIASSPAGMNWIEMYASKPDKMLVTPATSYWENGTGRQSPGLHGLLDLNIKTEVENGIKLEELQEFWWYQAKFLIHAGNEQSIVMTRFLDRLEIRHKSDESTLNAWQKQARPLLEKIVRYVDHLRSAEWQSNANRNPDVLPDLTKYRLSLLTWPTSLDDQPVEKKLDAFASGFLAAVEELTKHSPFYHERLPVFKDALLKLEPEHALKVAVKLASGVESHGQPTLYQWLCFCLTGDLASDMRRKSPTLDQQLVQQLVQQVSVLSESSVEDLRTRAKRMLKDVKPLLK